MVMTVMTMMVIRIVAARHAKTAKSGTGAGQASYQTAFLPIVILFLFLPGTFHFEFLFWWKWCRRRLLIISWRLSLWTHRSRRRIRRNRLRAWARSGTRISSRRITSRRRRRGISSRRGAIRVRTWVIARIGRIARVSAIFWRRRIAIVHSRNRGDGEAYGLVDAWWGAVRAVHYHFFY